MMARFLGFAGPLLVRPAMDLLRFSPEHLERKGGYYAVHATLHAHWKYFWFD